MVKHDMEPLLQANGISAGYRAGRNTSVVLHDVNVAMRAGEVVCMLGANGAGKSTLLRTLSREQAPLSGVVTVGGSDIHGMKWGEVARCLSVVYTERTHAGALTVEEVVSLGRQPYTGFLGRLDDTDREVVRDSIRAVGMERFTERFMATLSDGERQKVMIARALAQRTPIMMLDEPTTFLDVASRLEIMELLAQLAHEHGKAVLLSTHDVADALEIADRLWLLCGDGGVKQGTVDELVSAGMMDNLFAGRNVRFDAVAGDYRLRR